MSTVKQKVDSHSKNDISYSKNTTSQFKQPKGRNGNNYSQGSTSTSTGKFRYGNQRMSATTSITNTRGRPSACVFVASLSSNLSDAVLSKSVTEHFKQWGKVDLVKVLRDPRGRPYAFVQYNKDEEANKAIKLGQHSLLNGRTIRCEKARVNRTLFIRVNISDMTPAKMASILSQYGKLERLVPVDNQLQPAKNPSAIEKNWFAKYMYRQDAICAYANLKTRYRWCVEWAQNLEDEYTNEPEVTIDKYSIFIGHLNTTISQTELVERFQKHGAIKEAILIQRPLFNFAFVKFKSKLAAASAVEKENHSLFANEPIYVQYREMFNNYRKRARKWLTHKYFKLSLAPPPINFKKGLLIAATNNKKGFPTPKPVSEHGWTRVTKPLNKKSASTLNSSNSTIVEAIPKQHVVNNAPVIAGPKSSITNGSTIKIAKNPFSIKALKSSGSSSSNNCSDRNNDNEANEYTQHSKASELRSMNQDDDTFRSSNTEQSAGQRTYYTHSTFDDADDYSSGKAFASKQIPIPGPFNFPYYYIIPPKDSNFMLSQSSGNTSFPPGTAIPTSIAMAGSNPRVHPVGAPTSSGSSAGYYVPYAGFNPTSSNGAPPMYPFMFYYGNNGVASIPRTDIPAVAKERVLPSTH